MLLPHLTSSAARRAGLVVVLIVATLSAWSGIAQHGEQPLPAPAAAPAAKTVGGTFHPSREQWANLKVEEAKALTFRSVLITDGNIAFNDDALTPVFSPFSGRVIRVFAKLGDVVKKGAPLMAVDAAELVQGQSDIAAARAALDAARTTEKRQHDLYDAGAAALKDWRQTQVDLAVAQATHSAARGRLHILGRGEAEIDALEKAAATTTEAVVTAPIGGTITQRQVGIGQYIASAAGGSTNPLFTVGDLSTVWLVANVREGDASLLRLGQPAEVSVPALPDRTFKAKIIWIGAAVDAVTHRLPVRAEVQNRDGLLKPMMFASFSIATSEPVQAPAVPDAAVIHDGEKSRVFVVTDEASIAARSVRTGRNRNGMVEIVDGLRIGEKVVTAGTLFVDRAAEGN